MQALCDLVLWISNFRFIIHGMGTLYIVATPIGNLEDISIRALNTLFSVDVIACEDTRNTGQLLALLTDKFKVLVPNIGNRPELISLYDEIEESKSFEIIEQLKEGKNVALVSDAGTPLIADPGYKLLNYCIKENIPIVSIPGASSVTTALTVSGLPTNQFLFLGYVSPKHSKRIQIFSEIFQINKTSKTLNPTIVLLESPHRIEECLGDLKEIFGDIAVVIARELTKMHEETIRGSITTILKDVSRLKGELVVLFTTQ